MATPKSYSAFHEGVLIAVGPLKDVALQVRAKGAELRAAFVFDDESGEVIKLNTPEELDAALEEEIGSNPPSAAAAMLSVRLLGRHLEWLEAQPGGPSAAVRRLVDAARRSGVGEDRKAKEAAYRFISMLAGDFVGYEDACRALFAGDTLGFQVTTKNWAPDVRDYAQKLAAQGFKKTELGLAYERV